MKLLKYQFTPRPWAIVLYAVLLLCMLWLGNWQMNRAALKVSMAEAADQARQSVATPLHDVDDIPAAAASYKRVLARGQYDGERQFLWDNRTHEGRAGFEVLVPMRLEDGKWVLINRGWVAPGPSRSEFPDVGLPESAIGLTLSVEGLLSRPSRGFAGGEALSGEQSWPRLLQYLDYEAVSRALNVPLVPALLQVQALADNGNDPTILTARPEWLVANWQPSASGPAKHYSYAFQWFAMALALTIIFVVVNSRKPDIRPDQRKTS